MNNLSEEVKQSLGNLKQRVEDRLQLADSYRECFKGENGERVIRHLMKECGITRPQIITDTNLLLVRQGQQHIVLSILRIISKDNSYIIDQIEESMQNEVQPTY